MAPDDNITLASLNTDIRVLSERLDWVRGDVKGLKAVLTGGLVSLGLLLIASIVIPLVR